jgi:S1-C subfamily serine protease
MPPNALRTISLACLLASCASGEPAATASVYDESLVPGTIGVTVKASAAGVVIAAMGKESPAAGAGLRVGDVLLRYNGVSVADSRQFYGLMLDSFPGSTVSLEVLREGAVLRLEVPVRQVDTSLRV